jgi:hypothetical protein
MSESERDELLGRLVLDAFARHGSGTIPVRTTSTSVALVIPRIESAAATSIPDLPGGFVDEIRRRTGTSDQIISAAEFRERVVRNLRESADD